MLFRNILFRVALCPGLCSSSPWSCTKDEFTLHFKIPLCFAEVNADNFLVKRDQYLYRLAYGRCNLVDWRKQRDYSLFAKPLYDNEESQLKLSNLLESTQAQEGFYLFSKPFFIPTVSGGDSFFLLDVLPFRRYLLLRSTLGQYASTFLLVLIKLKNDLTTRKGLIYNNKWQPLSKYDPSFKWDHISKWQAFFRKMSSLFELVSQELSQDVSYKFEKLEPRMTPSLFQRLRSDKFAEDFTPHKRKLLNLTKSDLYNNSFDEETNSLMNCNCKCVHSSKEQGEERKNTHRKTFSVKSQKRKHLNVSWNVGAKNALQYATGHPAFVYFDKEPIKVVDVQFRTENDITYADLTVMFVAVYKQKLVRESWPDMHDDYGYDFPRVIYANFVLTKKVSPTVDKDFLISDLNYIVM